MTVYESNRMNRKLLLLYIFIFCVSQGVFSQITLNSNNFPVAGLMLGRGLVISFVNVLGNAGSDQFYDFTNVTPVLHDSVKYYNASQTPWASFHPGATIANAEEYGNNTYVYYYTPGVTASIKTGLTLIGDFGQGLDTVHGNYSDPDSVITTEYTYGHAETEYATANITNIIPWVNFKMLTKRNVLVDGWGALETPLNYYSDVLRVKCTEFRYDTASYFGSTVYTTADTQYFFNYYAKDVRHPVVKAHTDKNWNLIYFEYIYTPPVILGCTDSAAVNYNPMATQSDGSCVYCSVNYSITPDTTICVGASVTLNISGGSGYLWSDSTTASFITVSPTETTVYGVYVSDGPVCYALATVKVTVDKPVTAMFWTTLDHYNTGDVVQFVNLSSNATNYQWSFDDAVDGFSDLQYPLHTYTTQGMKNIFLISSNSCFADSTGDSLLINDNFSVNENAVSDGFTIYPNPGKLDMTVKGKVNEPTNIEIYAIDIFGRKNRVGLYENVNGDFSINNDMSRLSDGIYLIEINTGGSVIIKKWIKMQ